MSTQPTTRPRYAFGPFEFDSNTSELRKHRSLIRLQGQPLRILAILLDQPGEIVGRLELQRQLWPGVASGDFDHGLNSAVNKLRQVLNDSADQPRYIETLPSQGYRFIAPIQAHDAKPILELVPNSRHPKARHTRIPVLFGALAVLLPLTFWLGSFLQKPAPSIPPLQFTISPPPGYFLEPGAPLQSFALSPDGNSIAFSAMATNGQFHVFVHNFKQLESQLIPDSIGARTVFWSPDGQSLFFTSRGKLRRLTSGSTTSVIVSDAMSALNTGIPLSKNLMLISSSIKSAFVSIPDSSLQPAPKFYGWPQILPDGGHFIYSDRETTSFLRHVKVASLASFSGDTTIANANSRVVYTQSLNSSSGYLLAVNNGTLVDQPFSVQSRTTTAPPIALVKRVSTFPATGAADFSVSNTGVLAYQQFLERTQYSWVDRHGTLVAPASPPNLSGKYVSLSPDAKHIAVDVYDIETGVTNLWIFDAKSATGRRLAFPFGNRHGPIWSPDSRSIVYMRATASTPKLAMRTINESAIEESFPEADFMVPTSWSSDGRYILYNNTGTPLAANDGQSDIFAVDLLNKRQIRPFIQTPFHESNAVFSPDMSHVAFTSTESGRPELYLQSVSTTPGLHPSGERHLVSRQGAICLRWRPDGKELFYLGGDSIVYSVPVQLGSSKLSSTPVALFSIPAAARSSVHGALSFDVSADGTRFLIPTVSSSESPRIVIVRDWEAVFLNSAAK